MNGKHYFYRTANKEKTIAPFNRIILKEYIFIDSTKNIVAKIEMGKISETCNYIYMRYGIRSSFYAANGSMKTLKSAIMRMFGATSTYHMTIPYKEKWDNVVGDEDSKIYLQIVIDFLKYIKIRRALTIIEYDNIQQKTIHL